MTPKSSIAVGLVGPLPPPSGGMSNQTRQLGRLLEGEGLVVEIVQTNASCLPVWVERLRGVRALFRLIPYVGRLWHCAGRVDIVHVMANSGWAWHLFAAPAVWVAQLRGVPVILNYHGGEAETFMARRRFWIMPTLRRAFAVVVPSAFLEAVFARFGVATEIVPNVIDLARFHPNGSRLPRRHIIVTRNLEDVYDIPTALRAFVEIRRVHPDAMLTIAGSGPRLTDLRALSDALGISASVRYTGRLDNEHMADLYRDADLLLNPSTADNMPISLLEAMASGVPIVSTNVGGIPNLVTDQRDALLVPARDSLAMAAAALRVLAEPALGAALRQAGMDRAAAYTWAQVRPRLIGVYARALRLTSVGECVT